MRSVWKTIAVGALLTVFLISCRATEKKESQSAAQSGASVAGKTYTAYNLWYENPKRMFGVNYTRGVMIPAGTEVQIRRVGRYGKRPTVKFTAVGDHRKYTIYFRKQFRPGVSMDEIKGRLFTTKTFDELTKGLSPMEIKAIKRGTLVEGMSKRAVLVGRGYPPSHETPSLEADTWFFWDNRFEKNAVRFDENGRTYRTASDDQL